MSLTFDILVIILSSLLGIFLILSIVIAVLVLKLVGSVKRVVAKGEQVIDSAEAAAEIFKRASGPVNTFRTITSIIESITKHKR